MGRRAAGRSHFHIWMSLGGGIDGPKSSRAIPLSYLDVSRGRDRWTEEQLVRGTGKWLWMLWGE